MTTDLTAILSNPSKISDENKALATKNLFGLLKGVLKGSLLDLPRRTQETLEKFLNEGLQGFAGGSSHFVRLGDKIGEALGPATDIVGGFADTVLGALAIKSGVDSKDPLAQAAGGLPGAGGAFGASTDSTQRQMCEGLAASDIWRGFTAWQWRLRSTSQRQSLRCPLSIPGRAPSAW